MIKSQILDEFLAYSFIKSLQPFIGKDVALFFGNHRGISHNWGPKTRISVFIIYNNVGILPISPKLDVYQTKSTPIPHTNNVIG